MNMALSMKEWIGQELQKVEEGYVAKVLNMTGAYRREIERTKEYHGRQLLELLQNADDEAEGAKDPAVLIRLEPDRLVIANNGKPFSREGILSLMYSDNSPKVKRQRKIGYKGLGFRALLNWSHSIWIKSGPASIEFSRDNAKDFLISLIKRHPELKAEIESATAENEPFPIATLAVPRWKDVDSSDFSEFDTYVVINFSSEKVKEDIQRQINELSMEVALFLNNLRSIRLESPERNETIVRIPPGDDNYEEIRLIDENGDVVGSKRWRIFPKTGELPDELRKDETVKQYEYELRIAVGENLDDDIDRLFSYFKTEVKFPFPAIIHGTFDLDGNRNHLNESDVNKFLLKKLAELMIKTAKELTQATGDVNWDAMRLLARKGDFDDKVERMGFYDKLIDLMKGHKLIPVVSNRYMSAEEGPKFYRTPYANVLNQFPEIFPELAIYTEDQIIHDLIEVLGIEQFEPKIFVDKINQISGSLSIKDRADLILMIAENHKVDFENIAIRKMPSLFVDDNGRVIESKSQALLPPERTKFMLPDNISITFISRDLFKELQSKAGARTSRILASSLDCFNIREYSFDTVIRRIVNVTNRFIKNEKGDRYELIRDMLIALFFIYRDDKDSDNQFPANVNVKLITRKGKIRSAKDLYFGKEYSVGKIMDALYSSIDDGVFVAAKDILGFEKESEIETIELLEWLGVAKFPRIKLGETDSKDYEDYVLRNLSYPYTTYYGDSYSSYEELKKAKDDYYSPRIKIGKIDELDEILRNARFEDILAWLHADPAINDMIRNGHDIEKAEVELALVRKQYRRTISSEKISPYLIWKLKASPWIKTESGNKAIPNDCCIAKTFIDMSPLIEIPAYNPKDEVFKSNNISPKDIEYLLSKVGVSENFGALPTETIYSILKRLESADPEGKKAKTIYRQVIKSKIRERLKKGEDAKFRDEFVENGKLLAKNAGQTGYFPVKDVYYVDNITFCKAIMDKFPIVEIDRRSGKPQVRDVFGVRPLEDIKFGLASEPQRHHLDRRFGKAFEHFKPYILAFRLQNQTAKTELNRLKKLKIVLCTGISALYKHDGTEDAIQVNPYEHIQIAGENTAYLLLDPSKKYANIRELQDDIRFCESFAEIITGILKVEENRKDIRDLFPKNREQRDMVIRSDLDDPDLETLKKAKELFSNPTELEYDFWQSILEAKGSKIVLAEQDDDTDIISLIAEELKIDRKLVDKMYKDINYEDYSTGSNLSHIKRLFEKARLTVDEFNKASYEPIDFTEYFETEIKNVIFSLLNKFRKYLYSTLKGRSLDEKERLIEYTDSYEESSPSDRYDINKELSIDKRKYFDMLFKEEPFVKLNLSYDGLIAQEESDIDEKFNRNKEAFEQKLEKSRNYSAEDLDGFLYIPENKSLMYFGENDELLKRFNEEYPAEATDPENTPGSQAHKKISLNGKDEEYDEGNYQAFMENIDEDLDKKEYEIEPHNPEKPEDKPTNGTTKSTQKRKTKTRKNINKEIGFIGEYYVYKNLIKKYKKENVHWVSEYAKIAKINPDGNDNMGYDMRYIDKKGQVHYVEVKSSSDDNFSFPISSAEVRFGESHKSNYEIIQVLNVLSATERRFKNLGNIFAYDEEETFTNNSKFTVENEGFRIRFA